MTTYNVYLRTGAYTTVTVEADSPEAAVDEAYSADLPSLCAHCSGWGQSHNLELGEEWDIAGNLDEAVEAVS